MLRHFGVRQFLVGSRSVIQGGMFTGEPGGKKLYTPGAEFEQRGGQKNQIGRAQLADQRDGNDGTDDGSQRAAHADQSEEAFGLLRVEHVRHKGPEKGDDEQVEDADPNIEGAANPDALGRRGCSHQQVEEDEIRHEKAVGDGNEFSPRHARDDGGEKCVGHEHGDQCAGEHPGQAFEATGRRDVIPNGANDIIAAQNDEVEKKGQPERPHFVRLDVDDFVKQASHLKGFVILNVSEGSLLLACRVPP